MRLSERPRAAIVVTGSELVRGERTDRNGPFLAARRSRSGSTRPDRDRGRPTPTTSRRPSRDGLERRPVPRLGRARADPRRPHGRARRRASPAAARRRRRRSSARSRVSRARSPSGSTGRTPTSRRASTSRPPFPRAPSDRARRDGARASSSTTARARSSCCPGRPGELQRLWPARSRPSRCSACSTRTRRPAGARAPLLRRERVAVARALAEAGGDGDGVEATICARDFEIHVDLVVEPGARSARTSSPGACASARALPLRRGRAAVAEIVLELCRERGLTLATAESCTGGLVAARLTDVPGSSDVFRGRRRRLRERREGARARRPGGALAAHGAVSAEVAAAMADGVASGSAPTSPSR